jgi:hypothetical protein
MPPGPPSTLTPPRSPSITASSQSDPYNGRLALLPEHSHVTENLTLSQRSQKKRACAALGRRNCFHIGDKVLLHHGGTILRGQSGEVLCLRISMPYQVETNDGGLFTGECTRLEEGPA